MYLLLILISSVGADMSPRIVGGGPADIKDWSFIVFVAFFSKNETGTCGGSLISSQTVLTAAHCLDDVTHAKRKLKDFTFSVLMGHALFEKSTMIRFVLDYETHDKYDYTGPGDNDVGIMFLTKPVAFSSTVKKVLLSKSIQSKTDRTLMVAGWGAWSEIINDTHSNSPYLKSLAQSLLSDEKCQALLEEESIVHEGVICAGQPQATEYAYSGDSGGPLVRAGNPIQIGLVSFRLNNNGVTIYASIPYFYKWIEITQYRLFKKHCGWKKNALIQREAVEFTSYED